MVEAMLCVQNVFAERLMEDMGGFNRWLNWIQFVINLIDKVNKKWGYIQYTTDMSILLC